MGARSVAAAAERVVRAVWAAPDMWPTSLFCLLLLVATFLCDFSWAKRIKVQRFVKVRQPLLAPPGQRVVPVLTTSQRHLAAVGPPQAQGVVYSASAEHALHLE